MVVLVMASLRKTWTIEDSRVIVKRQLHIGNYNNVIDHGMSAAKREISDSSLHSSGRSSSGGLYWI